MEERLFWIGVGMGVYAYLGKELAKRDKLKTKLTAALWHALFAAGAAFSAAIVLVLSFETRSSGVTNFFAERQFSPALLAGAVFGALGFYRSFPRTSSAEGRKHFFHEDMEWAETVFSAVLLAAFLMYFVIQAFKIPSGSMRSTLLEGDHLFVNKFIYGVRIPLAGKRVMRLKPIERGDVVVFEFPALNKEEIHCGAKQAGKDFIKRVIGLPGDSIEVKGGVVLVNGKRMNDEQFAQYVDTARLPAPQVKLGAAEYQALWESRRLDQALGDAMRDYFGPVTVPPGSYLVMGDNRDRSCDSRFWGPVPESFMKGKAWFIYWPISRGGIVR